MRGGTRLESYLKHLVSNQPADYVEIRVEESRRTRIEFRGPTLDSLGESVDCGGCVRALVDGGWGFVSFNRLEGLEEHVALAVRQARLAGERVSGRSRLADAPVIQDKVTAELEEDPRQVPLAVKKDILESYNRQVLDFGPPIVSSRVVYFDKFTRLHFANSAGTYIEQEKLDLGGAVVAIAHRDGDTQMFSRGFGSSNTFGVVRGFEEAVEDACRRAAALIEAPVVEAGEYTVIVDPILAGVFVHEAFGHLSEADNVYENPNLQKVMTLGREFGGPHLNIYDTGLRPGVRGYLKYDDEGVPTQRTYLIKEGKLVGRLHSRETAGKMGEKVTGNARALDYRFPPICRMRTTGIEPGEATFEDMLKGIKLGVYVRSAYGGETAGEMFTFTAGDARMIRDGKLAEVVKNVTLTGNVFQTLKNIDMIGNDERIRDGAGGCGKGRQGPLATSMGSPHIRIRNVVIGGKAR
ncbi:MAG TPA: TldD/PmbA family protein [Clostridiales bacterium]|nr:TldD/PmbA family protein [Clostridiales bacterium]